MLIYYLILIVFGFSTPEKQRNELFLDPTPQEKIITIDMKDWSNFVYFRKAFVSFIKLPSKEQQVRKSLVFSFEISELMIFQTSGCHIIFPEMGFKPGKELQGSSLLPDAFTRIKIVPQENLSFIIQIGPESVVITKFSDNTMFSQESQLPEMMDEGTSLFTSQINFQSKDIIFVTANNIKR